MCRSGDVVTNCVARICRRAVKSAHDEGWVHGDLHMGNVLFTKHDGRVVGLVIDWDVAGKHDIDTYRCTLMSKLPGGRPLPRHEHAIFGNVMKKAHDIHALKAMRADLVKGNVSTIRRGTGSPPRRAGAVSEC